MADVTMKLEPQALLATRDASRAADELRDLGLDVSGPPPAMEQRGIDPMAVVYSISLTLILTATAMRNIDTIIEIARKWADSGREGSPRREIRILGPDGKPIEPSD